MKIANLKSDVGPKPAVQLSNGVLVDLNTLQSAGLLKSPVIHSTNDLLDINSKTSLAVQSLIEALEKGSGEIWDKATDENALVPRDKANLGAPVSPRFILSTGSAYRDHMAEMNVSLPEKPAAFQKYVHALTGPEDPIYLPVQAPDMIDFECEFACIFAKPCHHVSEAEALDYVAGYTMINDVSDRSPVAEWVQSLGGSNGRKSCELFEENIHGKQFPGFCPVGPVVTTKDELPDPHDINIGTILNGTLMQSANTRDLIFRLAKVISYFSHWYKFMPGDMLTTGSPAGVGYAQDPKVFLKPGDIVEVFGEGIGSLKNPVQMAP